MHAPIAANDVDQVTRVWSGRRRPDATPDPSERIGAVVDDWLLIRLLGVGGMSAVYGAVGPHYEQVAVKVVARRGASQDTLRREAENEASLARAVTHPGLVGVHSVGSCADGSAYLVMDLLEGETLEERKFWHGGAIAHPAALPIFDDLLDVVAAVHDCGIVHHDIKPGNVFLTRHGRLKLVDFGLARTGREPCWPRGWFGTPGFVAPEQARGEVTQCDRRADVWSLGATMFTVLSGESVHAADTHEGEVVLAAMRPARSLRTVAREVPLALVEVVDRALAFDPKDRWTDARAMLAALRSVVRPREPLPSGVRLVDDASAPEVGSWGEVAARS